MIPKPQSRPDGCKITLFEWALNPSKPVNAHRARQLPWFLLPGPRQVSSNRLVLSLSFDPPTYQPTVTEWSKFSHSLDWSIILAGSQLTLQDLLCRPLPSSTTTHWIWFSLLEQLSVEVNSTLPHCFAVIPGLNRFQQCNAQLATSLDFHTVTSPGWIPIRITSIYMHLSLLPTLITIKPQIRPRMNHLLTTLAQWVLLRWYSQFRQ